MTNTLHRYGDEHSLRNDFIVFAIPCRGHNDQDSVPKLREFLRMAVKHDPVNIGDGSKGGMYRPNKSLNPMAHWSRDTQARILRKWSRRSRIQRRSRRCSITRKPWRTSFRRCARRILGLSINISASIENAQHAAMTSTCRVTAWNIRWVSSGRPTGWPTGRCWSCPRCADTV